ncbi:TPA: LOW QUALITY PROTEIN: hypothetical protein N0F65_003252 [Lagenidium giganteum]|uniref:4-coumarate--CoA ligase n=1 Tax=Lagenidium giganteum TaxID=4803 RepID=A0AAV2YM58_9STRA|nr:TPA: LOW QUALITY PROTEIN: hypothetical protein N0F65_003252 [Lagenidium giganteum]
MAAATHPFPHIDIPERTIIRREFRPIDRQTARQPLRRSVTLRLSPTAQQVLTPMRLFTSPHGKLDWPKDASVWTALQQQAATRPNDPAFICGASNRTLSFTQVYYAAHRVGQAFLARGYKPGDVVVLHSINCIDYPVIFLGLMSVGIVTSPSSPLFRDTELADQCNIARAKALIVHNALVQVGVDAARLAQQPIDADHIFTIGECSLEEARGEQVTDVTKFFSFATDAEPSVVDPYTVVLLPFSSGTTGKPKGVEMTARGIYASVVHISFFEKFTSPLLAVLPLFHAYALTLMHISIYQGVPLVILPKFDAPMFLEAVSRHRIEKLHIAPPLVIFLAHHPIVAQYDLSCVKYLISAAAPLGREVEQLVEKRLNVRVKQAYGMTELSPAAHYAEDDNIKTGSCGRMLPNTEARVVSVETGEDLGPNEHGELWYRGPQVMKGYLHEPEATKSAITPDGFLKTGDIGYFDDDGYLFVVDRVKELIKYKGHQVAPAELEDVLHLHPAIVDSCCVRGYDPTTGEEIPKAYVVLKPSLESPPTAEQVMDFVSEKVAPFKKSLLTRSRRACRGKYCDVNSRHARISYTHKSNEGNVGKRMDAMEIIHLILILEREGGRRTSWRTMAPACCGSITFKGIFTSTSDLHFPWFLRPLPEDVTIWDFVQKHATAKGDHDAFICGISGRSTTYAELQSQVCRVAGGLHAHGVRKGDVVLLHSFNCIEWPVVFLALHVLGAITTPSSPLFGAAEIVAQIEASSAKFVVSHHMLLATAQDAATQVGISNDRVFAFGEPDPTSEGTLLDVFLNDESLELPSCIERVDPHAVTVLPFSSGTTGNPKGVQLTSFNMVASALSFNTMEPVASPSIAILPFFHIYPIVLMNAALHEGASLVILPRFEPRVFLNVISSYKMRRLFLAPPLIAFLARHPMVDEYDLSAVKVLTSGGSAVGRETILAVQKRLDVQVNEGFGMSELGGASSYGHSEWVKVRAVGRLIPNCELKIKCLKTDVDLPPNKSGELLFRMASSMKEYLNNEQATRAVVTEDGFIRTGDIGYIDDDGFIFIVGRSKEMIKYKGHQVAPTELEDVLNHHPAIAGSCCVRGWDAKRNEEIPKAFVALKPDQSMTEQQVMDYIEAKVAPYKKVRAVEFIDAIPHTASGKIARKLLQDQEDAAKP